MSGIDISLADSVRWEALWGRYPTRDSKQAASFLHSLRLLVRDDQCRSSWAMLATPKHAEV